MRPHAAALAAAAWLGVVGCAAARTSATGRDAAPVTELAAEAQVQRGLARVESVEILQLESFPVQVLAYLRGALPDSCTTLGEARQSREGRRILVTLETRRPADRFCAQRIVPFEHRLALEVRGLPDGRYEVEVNGVRTHFRLDVAHESAPAP